MANVALSEIKPIWLQNLSQGLITDMSPFEVPIGACSAVRNILFKDGFLRPRPGIGEDYTTLSTRKILHVNRYVDFDGAVYLTRVDYDSGTNTLYFWIWDGTSWSSVGSVAGESGPVTSCSWKGYIWYTTGGKLYRWKAGGTFEAVESVSPSADVKPPLDIQILIAGSARLFGADMLNEDGDRVPWRLAWCDSLEGAVWGSSDSSGSAGYVDLVDEESDPITGLYYSGSSIMVFKPNRIHIGIPAGPPKVFDFKEKVSGIGCISHKTIRPYRDGWVYWLGDDNVYRGGFDRSPEPVGDHIIPRIREVIDVSRMEDARAIMDRENHFYTLILPALATGKNSVMFTLNLKNGGWWEGAFANPGMNVTDTLEYRQGEWDRQILLATDTGKIYAQSFSYQDDAGTPVAMEWTSGIIPVGALTNGQAEQATVQQLRIQAYDGNVRLGVWKGDSIDRMTLVPYGTQTCDGTSSVMKSERSKSAENFKVQINQDSMGEAAKISKIGVGAILLEGKTRR